MSGWGLSHVGEDYDAFLWTADFWGQQIAFALLDISGVPR